MNMKQAKTVMSLLMSIAPQKAVIADIGEVVDVDKVKVNTVLSFPVAKLKDLPLWVGTINLNGKLHVFIGTREDIKKR